MDGLPGTPVEMGRSVIEVVRRTDTHALRVRDPAVGVVRFELDGQEHELVALPGKTGGLSLHSRDATSGDSTYPGGRIVRTTEPAPDGRLTLDLNRVVNLPCGFTDFATCLLPPAENVLPVAVEAGERTPLRPDHR